MIKIIIAHKKLPFNRSIYTKFETLNIFTTKIAHNKLNI